VARSPSAKKNNLFGVLEEDSDDGVGDDEEDDQDDDVEGELGGRNSDDDDDQEHHDKEALVRNIDQVEEPEESRAPETPLDTVGGTMAGHPEPMREEAGVPASESRPDLVASENELRVIEVPEAEKKKKKRRRPGRRDREATARASNLTSITNATQTSVNKPGHDGDAVQIVEEVLHSLSTLLRSTITLFHKSLATAEDALDVSGRSFWELFGGAAHAKDPGHGGSISKSLQTGMEVFVRSLEASMNDVNRESCRRLGDAWGSPDISPEEWSRMRLEVGACLETSGLETLTTAEALGLDTYHKKGCLGFKSEGSESTCCAHPDGEIAKSWRQTSTAGSSSRRG